jgi:hypothetical protein
LEFAKLQEYEKQITSSCIGAIFTQNLTALEEKCPINIDKKRETLTPISGDSYILQTTNPQTISIV